MLDEFFRQQAEAPSEGPVIFELSTSGGDADIGRRIAQEIRQWRNEKADLYFLGKSFVYSAGVTIMGAFDRSHRFLSPDCELLIHERKLKKTLRLDGALRACAAVVKNTLAEIQSGERLERDGETNDNKERGAGKHQKPRFDEALQASRPARQRGTEPVHRLECDYVIANSAGEPGFAIAENHLDP